jgi:hypothetical protein
MTISSTTNTVSYTGNGSTTAFAVPYAFFGTGTTSEIQVVEVVIATGAETVKSNGSDYTVAGGSGTTGTVTAATAPASTVKWVINRATTQTQETDYVENDPFPAESHEEALDRLTAIDQEQQRALDRTAQLPDGYTGAFDPTLPTIITGSTVLAFNAGATAFEIGPTTAAISGAAAAAAAAAVSANAAAASAAAAATSYDDFDDRYLGQKATDPTLDNDGDALLTGALYFNTSNNVMMVYTGSAWVRTTPTTGDQANIDAVTANATNINTVATNVVDITNFADVYIGPSASDPTVRVDTSPLQAGDLYFNTTVDELRVYSGSQWVAGTAGTLAVQRYSGDGSTVAFTLATAPTGENNTQVYVSGVYQQKDTYSVSGVTLTFSAAPPIGTDNIEVVTISTLALGETDASLVTYTASGAGVVERTVESVLRETVSVTDFGAVGDGVTDDAAAFQAAIDAATAAATIGTSLLHQDTAIVLIPAGRYRLDTGLFVNDFTQLRGAGQYQTQLVFHNATGYGISPYFPTKISGGMNNVRIEGMIIDGANAGAGTIGIYMPTAHHCKLNNLWVRDFGTSQVKLFGQRNAAGAIDTNLPGDATLNRFENCVFLRGSGNTVDLTGTVGTSRIDSGTCNMNTFDHCYFSGDGGAGCFVEYGTSNGFPNCRFLSVSGDGLKIQWYANTAYNVVFESCGGYGLNIVAGSLSFGNWVDYHTGGSLTAGDYTDVQDRSFINARSGALQGLKFPSHSGGPAGPGIMSRSQPDDFVYMQDSAGVNQCLASAYQETAVAASVASASSSIAFDIPADATWVAFVFNSIIPTTDAVSLRAQVSTDGGSTYQATNYDYHVAEPTAAAATYAAIVSTSGTAMQLASTLGSSVSEGLSGMVHLFDPANTTIRKHWTWHLNQHNSSSVSAMAIGGGLWDNSSSAINNVKFFMSSGTIASGNIKMYVGRG